MRLVSLVLISLLVILLVPSLAFGNARTSGSYILSYASSSSSPLVNTTFTSNAPTVVTITFPFTNTIRVQVNPVGGGLYNYKLATTEPNSVITINLNGSDYYNILLSISYPTTVTGIIDWRIYGPGLFPQSQQIIFTNQSSIEQESLIQVQSYQTFPDAQEIANATVSLQIAYLQHLIGQYQAVTNRAVAQQQQEIFVDQLTSSAVFAVVVVAGLYFILRKTRRDQ